MKKVIIDSSYWYSLENNPERFEEFYEVISSEDIIVYLSFGNFIDFVRADEQDTLSKILTAFADKCLPPTPSDGNEYIVTSDPIGLIPDADFREFVREQTSGLGVVDTLQYIFRNSDWSAGEGYYDTVETMRRLYQEWGHDNMKGLAFEDYLERRGEKYILHEHDVDVVEYVQQMIFIHRISHMTLEENIKENDVADMIICIQAILSDCDVLLHENKWINVELVESVTENLESDRDLKLYKDFDKFLGGLN